MPSFYHVSVSNADTPEINPLFQHFGWWLAMDNMTGPDGIALPSKFCVAGRAPAVVYARWRQTEMPNTVTAVFQDGVLKPTRKLKLRPNEKVKLQILRQGKRAPAGVLGPLAGAFPELAALSDKDLAAAKQIWTRRLRKQSRMLSRKGPRR